MSNDTVSTQKVSEVKDDGKNAIVTGLAAGARVVADVENATWATVTRVHRQRIERRQRLAGERAKRNSFARSHAGREVNVADARFPQASDAGLRFRRADAASRRSMALQVARRSGNSPTAVCRRSASASSYSGASTTDLQTEVAEPIEDQLAGTPFLDHIQTRRSRAVKSRFRRTFSLQSTDTENIANVEKALQAAQKQLPTHDHAADDARRQPERTGRHFARARLEQISRSDARRDRQQLDRSGARTARRASRTSTWPARRSRRSWSTVNPNLLAADNLTLTDVVNAITPNNLRAPGGYVYQPGRETDSTCAAILPDPQAVADLPIHVTYSGTSGGTPRRGRRGSAAPAQQRRGRCIERHGGTSRRDARERDFTNRSTPCDRRGPERPSAAPANAYAVPSHAASRCAAVAQCVSDGGDRIERTRNHASATSGSERRRRARRARRATAGTSTSDRADDRALRRALACRARAVDVPVDQRASSCAQSASPSNAAACRHDRPASAQPPRRHRVRSAAAAARRPRRSSARCKLGRAERRQAHQRRCDRHRFDRRAADLVIAKRPSRRHAPHSKASRRERGDRLERSPRGAAARCERQFPEVRVPSRARAIDVHRRAGPGRRAHAARGHPAHRGRHAVLPRLVAQRHRRDDRHPDVAGRRRSFVDEDFDFTLDTISLHGDDAGDRHPYRRLDGRARKHRAASRRRRRTADAALNGRSEIGLAAIVITLVDVVVFLPIAFVGGQVGVNSHEFAIVVIVATLTSLFVSFTVTPSLAGLWSLKSTWKPWKPIRWFDARFNGLRARYARTVAARGDGPPVADPHRRGGACVARVSARADRARRRRLHPGRRPRHHLRAGRVPAGHPLTQTIAVMSQLEARRKQVVTPHDLQYETTIAGAYSAAFGGFVQEGNVGQISIFLNTRSHTSTYDLRRRTCMQRYRQVEPGAHRSASRRRRSRAAAISSRSTSWSRRRAAPIRRRTPRKVFAALQEHAGRDRRAEQRDQRRAADGESTSTAPRCRRSTSATGTAAAAVEAAFGGDVATQIETPTDGLTDIEVIYPRSGADLARRRARRFRCARRTAASCGSATSRTFNMCPAPLC